MFRYSNIFLPMYAACLHQSGQVRLSRDHLKRARALLREAQQSYADQTADAKQRFRTLFGATPYACNGKWLSSAHGTQPEFAHQFMQPYAVLPNHVWKRCPVPPLDVAFCWLLHRLSPSAYEADCLRLFGTSLSAGSPEKIVAGPQALLHHVWYGTIDEEPSIAAGVQWACFASTVRRLPNMAESTWDMRGMATKPGAA